MHMEFSMSKFVEHSLYRSSVHPVKGKLSKDVNPWWVFDLSIVDMEFNEVLYSLQVVSSTWDGLEFELCNKHDKDLCRALIATFPDLIRRNSSISEKRLSLYDEYSNQYFSDLMGLISYLPVFR